MTQQEFFLRYTYNTRTDKLGGGAFGTVYKAYDNVLDKYVAIKISEVKTIGGKEFSLMDEFNAIKGLNDHANIAKYEQLFSFDQPNGVFDFAIIQYYPDGNLKDLIKNEKLTQTEKEKIAKQILDGLSFLHQHKVVHRDMKPSNILIHKRDGKNYIPKIADFGLSKKADPNAKSRFTNSFGGGTLEYSSPEQLRGQNLRFNTDLWAWAVIVYELFTEKPLFQPKNNNTASAENEKEIFEQILNKDITISLKEIPTNWSNALLACLNRNPETRIKTANEIYDILNSSKTKSDAKPKEDETKVFVEEIKNELKQKEEQTKVFEKQIINKGKKKSYKYLLWLIPVVIAFVSVLLYFNFFSAHNTITSEKIIDYDEIRDFRNGLAAIKKGEKWGFVDVNYNLKIPLIYDEVNYWSFEEDSVAPVTKGEKEGLIDMMGKEITDFKYTSIQSFENGFAIARVNNVYGVIDNKGKERIPLFYNAIETDDYKYFTVNILQNEDTNSKDEKTVMKGESDISGGIYSKGTWKIIDINNKIIIDEKYNFLGTFSEGLIKAKKNGKFGFINLKNDKVIDFIYDKVSSFKQSKAIVESKNNRGLINKKGEIIVPIVYEDISYEHGKISAKLNGKWISIDEIELKKTNAEIINNSNWRDNYDKIYPFSEGLAMVKKNDKYGYVNNEGKLVIPLIYYGGRDFSEGLALVLKKNFKRGYINKNNKIIIPMIYDDGFDFENGFTRVAIEEFGYFTINKKGECIKDCPN